MTAKIIMIMGVSIAVVAGIYILGKCADKGGAGAKEDSPSRHDAA